MSDSSRFQFEPRIVDDFTPISQPQTFREHLEWYLDGCTPYASSPRIQEVTDCLVGKANPTESIDAVAEAIQIKNMDAMYREIAERGLKLLLTVEHHDTRAYEYIEQQPPCEDMLWFREVRLTQKTTFLIHEKSLFKGLIETSVYDFDVPRNVEKEKQDLTQGFTQTV